MSGEKPSAGRLQKVRRSMGNGVQHTKNGVTHVRNANFRLWWFGKELVRWSAAVPVLGAAAVFGIDAFDRRGGGSGMAHEYLNNFNNLVTEAAQGNPAQQVASLAGQLVVGGAKIGEVANAVAHLPAHGVASAADLAGASDGLSTGIRDYGDAGVDVAAIGYGGWRAWKYHRVHPIAPPRHIPTVPVG